MEETVMEDRRGTADEEWMKGMRGLGLKKGWPREKLLLSEWPSEDSGSHAF